VSRFGNAIHPEYRRTLGDEVAKIVKDERLLTTILVRLVDCEVVCSLSGDPPR
jgi:hypothetical protein